MDTLEVTGINKIIWIDDDFADISLDKDSLIDEILEHIKAYLDAGTVDEIPTLVMDKLDFDVPVDILLDETRHQLASLENDVLRQIAESIEGDRTEFSDAAINSISNNIAEANIDLIKMPLSEWRSFSPELEGIGQETLFLIDKEFTKEGESDNAGQDILRELMQRFGTQAPPNYILFTHTCRSTNEEEDLRVQIFDAFKKDASLECESFNFQVLSKSVAYDRERAETRLFNCIRAMFVRKLFSQMAHSLKNEIISSIDSVTDKLIGTNIYGLDRSIFGSSISEGVSELELLQRMFSLSQRTAVSRMIKNDTSIVSELTKLRRLKALAYDEPDDDPINLDEFKRIRQEEFWLSGDDINRTFTPLVCGDIFKLKKREFILISQPCDTILRSDGKRKTNTAVLVPIKRYDSKTDPDFDKNLSKYSSAIFSFVFSETNKETSFWCVRMNDAVPVNLDMLDLCTFNEAGKVEFDLSQERPQLLHLEGQIARFELFKTISKDVEAFPNQICLDSGIMDAKKDIADLEFKQGKGWTSKLTRVRRLEPIYAEHALNKYYAYKSRKAFEHDFTRH